MKSREKRRQLEEHYLDFFAFAMAILRDVDDAKDAVQDAMVKVLTARRVDDVRKYTNQAVRSAAMEILRRRSHLIPLGDNMPDKESEHEARLRMVAQLRDELPEALRALVELYDEEGYSIPELAVLTGLSHATLWRRIDKAHEILKKKIEEEIYEK